MKISRIVFEKESENKPKPLARCYVVLDDCLRLNNICLYHNEKGYYLVLPSKQDLYREVQEVNEGIKLELPKNKNDLVSGENKKYEEFYHPLSNSFYKTLLNEVLHGYRWCKKKELLVYRPKE